MHLSLFCFLIFVQPLCHVVNKFHTRSALACTYCIIFFLFPPCTCGASFLFSFFFLVYRASLLPTSPLAGEYCSDLTHCVLRHYHISMRRKIKHSLMSQLLCCPVGQSSRRLGPDVKPYSGNEAQTQLKPSHLVFSTVASEEAILLRAQWST